MWEIRFIITNRPGPDETRNAGILKTLNAFSALGWEPYNVSEGVHWFRRQVAEPEYRSPTPLEDFIEDEQPKGKKAAKK